MSIPNGGTSSRGGRWRAFLAGCLMSFLLLELLLRLLTLAPWSTADFVADETTGFRQRPGVTIAGNQTNSRGFNDAEPGPKSGMRIGVVGDSFVFSAVPRGQDLVSLLAAEARPAGVEVLNLGILAAGPENYLGVLEKDGAELALDAAVVVVFVGNDISQADPHFKTRVFFGAPRAVLGSPWLLRPGVDYVYSVKMIRGGWRLLHELRHPAEAGGTFSRRIFLEIEGDRLEICRRAPTAKVERGYLGMAAFFDRLQTFGRERQMPVAVVLAPDQFQVDAALSSVLIEKDEAGAFDLELPQQRLGAELEKRGIPYLDLLPVLRREGTAATLYLERDSHWNAEGNRLAAESVAAALRSWGWLPGSPGTPLDSPAQGD
jgi:hypothetical protein